jgi:hypothetical protein
MKRLLLFLVILLLFASANNSWAVIPTTITWDAPTTNSDGSPITDLAGYEISYGTESGIYYMVQGTENVTYTFSSLSGGLGGITYYFSVRAYDFDGNMSDYSYEVSKYVPPDDSIGPVVSLIGTAVSDTSVVITWQTNEIARNTNIDYGLSTAYGSQYIGIEQSVDHSATLLSLMAGTLYHHRITGCDLSGNCTTTGDLTFTTSAPADTTPPVGTISINSGSTSTSSSTVTLALSSTEISGAQMKFSNDNVTWTTAESFAMTKSLTLPSGDGTKTVYAKFADSAGNWSDVVSDMITLDTTAPTGTIVINANVASTNSTAVTFTLTSTETSGAQMKFSNDNVTWSTAQTFATTKSWNLASGDGNKTVYVKFADSVGNWSVVASDTITLDTTAPVISGITVSPTADGLTVAWATTGDSSDSTVEFGTTPDFSITSGDTSLSTAHSLRLSNLSESTTYYYRIKSRDSAGNQTVTTGMVSATSARPSCSPPANGDWTIISNCTLRTNYIAPASVIVSNNATLTIPLGVYLKVNVINYKLSIEQGSGILVRY